MRVQYNILIKEQTNEYVVGITEADCKGQHWMICSSNGESELHKRQFGQESIHHWIWLDNSKGDTITYLQCSTNRLFAVPFYTKNGFHNKGNNMNLIPDSIKPKEKYFIKEDQISLMICNHRYFQCKISESSERVNKDQFLEDIKIYKMVLQ